MNTHPLARRDFMQLAAWAAAGALVAGKAQALSADQRQFLLDNPNFVEGELKFFDAETRALVTHLADMILPRTATPGAVDAKAPAFIELMVDEWMNDQERATFMGGLDDLKAQSFMAMDEGSQVKVLEGLESAAGDHNWYEIGNIVGGRMDSTAPFICQLKELTCFGFFMSETGATEALAYNHMAGYLEGDIPLEDGQPSWSGEVLTF